MLSGHDRAGATGAAGCDVRHAPTSIAQIVDSEIVELFSISQPSISRHLRILREAGLVSVQPEGRQRLYDLDPRPLHEIDSWLERYRKFWARKLDSLEQHLDEETVT